MLCRCFTSIVVVGSCSGWPNHSEYPDGEGTRRVVSPPLWWSGAARDGLITASTLTVRVPDVLCCCVATVVVVGSCSGRPYHSEYPDCEGTRRVVSVCRHHCDGRELLGTALSQRVP